MNRLKTLELALKKEKEARLKVEQLLKIKKAEIEVVNKNLTSVLEKNGLDFKYLFETIVDNYLVTDLFGNILKMNKAAIEFTGFNPKNESVNVVDIIHKDDFKYAISSFRNFLKEESSKIYQLRIYTKKKEIKWIEFKPNLILNSKGEPEFTQGIFRDVTQIKQDKQISENQRKELDAILDNSQVGIVLANTKGNIIKSNKAFQNFLDFSEEQLLQKNVEEISFQEEDEKTSILMEELYEGRIDNFIVNKRYKTKKGIIIWAKTQIKSVKNEVGKITHQVAVVQDITKELEQEKKLEFLLEDLTEKNKELRDFAHVVSHDLKAPLRNMNTLVSWLEEESVAFSSNNNKNFKLLHKNLEKMDLLIAGILNYTTVDKVQNKKKNIDLNLLLKDIIDITYVPKHIQINLKSILPTVRGDVFRMQQLFQNLVNNAVKYIDKKQGIINIDCILEDEFWKFSIEDNGIGISEKYFEKIFEVFQSLEKVEGSSGIGLSIVKKIIHFYNGKIWLTSVVNKGTTFYFTIPK
ncbi:PAS domain S-box protein [Polaribacter sp. MSW13]|uniref:histidine kinase n=1 Tax=Polaribacter marinus TaxID=2916838 RepID=A0A9X1VNC9_9FLAO|nr:PAS domain-containing sensor histidine kinase [Polaribacter marinus]MCI2229248.1 PAS domain S-box protein [Polaribacter marinus]